MFNENIIYEKNDVDLMQLVDELMLKIMIKTFEISKFFISAIIKFDFNFDKKIIINNINIVENFDQSKKSNMIELHLIKIFFRHRVLFSMHRMHMKILKILILF